MGAGAAGSGSGVPIECLDLRNVLSSPFPRDRRLCPDISFFQRATEYPCLLILDPQNEFETLRKRVEQTTLKSQTVARNRSGVTNVRGNLGPPGPARDCLYLLAPLGPLAIGPMTMCPASYLRQRWSCQTPLLPGLLLKVRGQSLGIMGIGEGPCYAVKELHR